MSEREAAGAAGRGLLAVIDDDEAARASMVQMMRLRRYEVKGFTSGVAACQASPLAATRTQTVFGVGDPSADWLFIGEAPGADEDLQGQAFVGAAGQFLTKMIQAMGYARDDVFIANICKCRPPNNRTPQPEEMQKCLPFLREQIAIVRTPTATRCT